MLSFITVVIEIIIIRFQNNNLYTCTIAITKSKISSDIHKKRLLKSKKKAKLKKKPVIKCININIILAKLLIHLVPLLPFIYKYILLISLLSFIFVPVLPRQHNEKEN